MYTNSIRKEVSNEKNSVVFHIYAKFFIIPFANTQAASNEQPLVKEIKEIIKENYVGTIKGDLQNAKTIPEMIDMLDPYSTYFTKQEFEEFMNSINLATIGIGVIIEEHEDGIHILQVIDNSGASDAGVIAGDIITEINGQSIVGRSTQEASSLLVGDEGTKVDITLQNADGKTSTKSITRKNSPYRMWNRNYYSEMLVILPCLLSQRTGLNL